MKKLLFSEKMLLLFIRYNMVPAFLTVRFNSCSDGKKDR
jgi:hypothetical protein